MSILALPNSPTSTTPSDADKCIVWLDIDNTLYPSSSRVAELMTERIRAYFQSLGLSESEAKTLHRHYYTEYGLAIRGLVRHHQIDALDFDRRCDGSLPLEEVLKPDPKIRQLLQDLDRNKTRVWGLTNAYSTHAQRVLRILNLEDQLEGVIYCNYADPEFTCKPEPEFYQQAMKQLGVTDPQKCYFVDDNLGNVRAARNLGWKSSVYFRELHPDVVLNGNPKEEDVDGVDATIDSLEQLRLVWKDLFVSKDIQ